MNDIQGVLFDADGTLIDTYDIILASMRYAVNDVLGCSLDDAELMACRRSWMPRRAPSRP